MSPPAAPVEAGGLMWVPGNRWDLVAGRIGGRPRSGVAVVVTYFEQPTSLLRMYGALADLDPASHELIVADDGSRSAPPVPPAGFPVPTRIVRQRDMGCRPGAARNLGAAASSAPVLVFLDADTVPGPRTVDRLAAWPDLLPDTLVVGRRGHVDLTGWSPGETVEWLAGRGAEPARRPDPAWLAEGYRMTRDLLDADDRSYRFVISAVMACHRTLWSDIGGFDPDRDEYGGDDWEFASRAFNNGAVLVHDPNAVAWHDEPDWSQRDGGSKNDETLWLATVIAEPATRGGGVLQPWPDTLVHLDLPSTSPGAIAVTARDVLDDVPDAQVRVPCGLPGALQRYFDHDPRLTTDAPTIRQQQRARHIVSIHRPTRWPPASLGSLLDAMVAADTDVCEVRDAEDLIASISSTRGIGRRRRAGTVDIERLLTRSCVVPADLGVVVIDGDVDLAATLRRSSSTRGA